MSPNCLLPSVRIITLYLLCLITWWRWAPTVFYPGWVSSQLVGEGPLCRCSDDPRTLSPSPPPCKELTPSVDLKRQKKRSMFSVQHSFWPDLDRDFFSLLGSGSAIILPLGIRIRIYLIPGSRFPKLIQTKKEPLQVASPLAVETTF